MTEADVWRVIINVLRTGLDSQRLHSVLIKQSFQPVKQGVDIQDTVYLFKITSRRYGFQGKNFIYNAGEGYFDGTENYWIEATFQLSALVQRDITDSSSLTSYDVADRCGAIMQTELARKTMLDSGVGILRVNDVRNPFSISDHDQFEQDSNFDFILTYNQTISSIVPIADPINLDIQRV